MLALMHLTFIIKVPQHADVYTRIDSTISSCHLLRRLPLMHFTSTSFGSGWIHSRRWCRWRSHVHRWLRCCYCCWHFFYLSCIVRQCCLSFDQARVNNSWPTSGRDERLFRVEEGGSHLWGSVCVHTSNTDFYVLDSGYDEDMYCWTVMFHHTLLKMIVNTWALEKYTRSRIWGARIWWQKVVAVRVTAVFRQAGQYKYSKASFHKQLPV